MAQAQAQLHSGEFQAAIDYGRGTRSSEVIDFDLNPAGGGQALQSTTVYTQPKGTRTVDLVTIGDQSWQRQGNGPWTRMSEQEGVWGRVQAFLPHTDTASDPAVDRSGNTIILHWFDTSRDLDVTLQVDAATAIPRKLSQLTRATGATLTVTYAGWNTPVKITPPVGG